MNSKKEKTHINKNDFTLDMDGQLIKFDCAFIMIHGSPGEDGKLQGYLDLLHIPYPSCGTTTAALSMNKSYTKRVVSHIKGLQIAHSILLFKNQPYSIEAIAQELHFPLFIKPNNGGSSIGMSKVNNIDKLDVAIQTAFKEDTQVLVEEFIKGREFTVLERIIIRVCWR